MTLEMFSMAYEWLSQGVAVFPLEVKGKKPAGALLPGRENGHASWKPFQSRLPSIDELWTWFSSNTPYNLAIVTGWNGLAVIDFDAPGAYECWRGLYPQMITYQVTTGRGMHVYVYLEEPALFYKDSWGEVRTGGAYVVGERSIHPNGSEYKGNGQPIARVKNIQAIMPAELLTASMPVAPAGVIPVMPFAPVMPRDDPWAAAINPSPDNLVSAIKARVRILDFFPNARPSGNGFYKTCCPFHDDQNPSFWIDSRRELCGCLAGCTQKPMDVINLVARWKGLDQRGALEYLKSFI